jgi:hypothetical protein
MLVEIEVHKSETDTEKVESSSLDVNEIIGKVRSFVDSIRDMSPSGEPMKVTVEGFNFSLSKSNGQYDLSVKLNLSFKPKAVPAAPAAPAPESAESTEPV